LKNKYLGELRRLGVGDLGAFMQLLCYISWNHKLMQGSYQAPKHISRFFFKA